MNELGSCARTYFARGWLIVPLWWANNGVCACYEKAECSSPGKHPHSKNGTRDPLKTGLDVDVYWLRYPQCNIGIATGEKSNLVVLDIDPRHGGFKSYQRLVKAHGNFPDTPVSITGGGGRHVLFSHPGVRIKNAIGFIDGMDIRADGGLIVAPPSTHVSGEAYRWHSLADPSTHQVVPLPMWLFRLIYDSGAERDRKRRQLMPRSKGSAKIDITKIPAITEGGRNDKLCSIAGRLFWEKRTVQEVTEAIEYINRTKCTPPLPDGEVNKLLRSASSKWSV